MVREEQDQGMDGKSTMLSQCDREAQIEDRGKAGGRQGGEGTRQGRERQGEGQKAETEGGG